MLQAILFQVYDFSYKVNKVPKKVAWNLETLVIQSWVTWQM